MTYYNFVYFHIWQYITLYYSLFSYMTVYYFILQFIFIYDSILLYITFHFHIWQYIALYYSLFSYMTVYRFILQFIFIWQYYYSILLCKCLCNTLPTNIFFFTVNMELKSNNFLIKQIIPIYESNLRLFVKLLSLFYFGAMNILARILPLITRTYK